MQIKIENLKSKIASLLVLFWVIGCHTNHTANTPSGRPEVMIEGKKPEQILQATRAFFVNRGYGLTPSDNGYKLIFDRRTERPGGKPSTKNCWRVRVFLSDLSNGTFRLWAVPAKVESCGGELEAEHVMPDSFSQVQELLEQIKFQLDAVP